MLIRKEENESIIWGVWKIEETTEELLSQLNKEDPHLNRSSPKRLKEQVAVRVLLKALINEEKSLEYTSSGKPYLKDGSYSISISHTKGYATVILSNTKRIGIDIEYISEKVERVKDRFISAKEYIDPENNIIHLLLHWSAKETMYKALGYAGVDFREHLLIDRFTPSTHGRFNSHERHSDQREYLEIEYFVEEDYVLTLTY